MCIVLGHYTDIHSITYIGRRVARSGDDDGHYSDIRSIVGHGGAVGRSESIGHYQYIDVDRVETNSGDVVDQLTTGVDIGDVRRGRGYERLDPSVIATVSQTPSAPHHYSALAAAAAESTQQADAEVMEMSQFDAANNLQDNVSQQLYTTFAVNIYRVLL